MGNLAKKKGKFVLPFPLENPAFLRTEEPKISALVTETMHQLETSSSNNVECNLTFLGFRIAWFRRWWPWLQLSFLDLLDLVFGCLDIRLQNCLLSELEVLSCQLSSSSFSAENTS